MKAPTLIIFVVTATAWADTINFDDVKPARYRLIGWLHKREAGRQNGTSKWLMMRRANQTCLSNLA
jgi:hypothetical protein